MPFSQQHGDEDLLDELRRVAELEPSDPLTQRVFAKHSTMVATVTMLRRFGSWREALTLAGLADRYSGRVVSTKMQSRCSIALSDHEILAELRRVAKAAGTGYVTRRDVTRRSKLMGVGIVTSRFGSFAAAAAAAGLKQSSMANRWSEQDYIDNLRLVAAHLGRAPIQEDMNRPPSKITGDSYRHRFKSWGSAVNAARGNPPVF